MCTTSGANICLTFLFLYEKSIVQNNTLKILCYPLRKGKHRRISACERVYYPLYLVPVPGTTRENAASRKLNVLIQVVQVLLLATFLQTAVQKRDLRSVKYLVPGTVQTELSIYVRRVRRHLLWYSTKGDTEQRTKRTL